MIRTKISCSDCNNSNCLIKKSCPVDLIEFIDNHKTINIIRKKQTVFYEGNESYQIYFVHSGLIKVFKNGAFNRDQIVRFSFKGNILGHRGLIKKNIYPVSAKAIIDSEICCFSKDFFFDLLNKAPQLAVNLMLFFADELHQEETKIRDMAIFNVREKVAKGLLVLIETFGLNSDDEINDIHILSRQDIADSIGITPNQVTKELASFKDDNLIKTYKKNIKIISKERIEHIVSYVE